MLIQPSSRLVRRQAQLLADGTQIMNGNDIKMHHLALIQTIADIR